MNNRSVSLVTGAGRGIGRGIAVELAKLGHAVVVNYAGNAKAAEECLRFVREAGGDGMTAQADVSVSIDRERLVQETIDAYGRIDLLVNNSKSMEACPVNLASFGQFTRQVEAGPGVFGVKLENLLK